MIKFLLSILISFVSFGMMAQEAIFSNLSQFGMGSALIDAGQSIAYDHNNSLIVYGSFSGNMDFNPGAGQSMINPLGNPDLFLAKYQQDGTLDWAFNLGRLALSGGMAPSGLVIDENNNILISGSFSNSVDFDPSGNTEVRTSEGGKDAFLAKYNSDGDFMWVNTYGSIFFEYGEVLGLTAAGDIYLALRYNGEIDLDPGEAEVILTPYMGASDAALVKYNAAGEYQWNYSISTPDNDNITCISVSSSGMVAIGSTINGATTGFNERDMQLSMLQSDGTLMWEYNFANYEKANNIKKIVFTDDDTNIIIGGRIEGNTDFDPSEESNVTIDPLFADPFFAKYEVSTGNLIWARLIKSGGTEDYLSGLTVSGSSVIVAGSFDNTATFNEGDFTSQKVSAGGSDIYMAAYSSEDGAYIGSEIFGGPGSEVSSDARFLPSGNMAMTGVYTSSLKLNSEQSAIPAIGYTDVFFGEFSYQIVVSDGLKVVDKSTRISMYPIPAANVLNIDVNNSNFSGKLEVKIMNVVGQIVMKKTLDMTTAKSLDVSQLRSGVYIIDFKMDGQNFSKRFVKQ